MTPRRTTAMPAPLAPVAPHSPHAPPTSSSSAALAPDHAPEHHPPFPAAPLRAAIAAAAASRRNDPSLPARPLAPQRRAPPDQHALASLVDLVRAVALAARMPPSPLTDNDPPPDDLLPWIACALSGVCDHLQNHHRSHSHLVDSHPRHAQPSVTPANLTTTPHTPLLSTSTTSPAPAPPRQAPPSTHARIFPVHDDLDALDGLQDVTVDSDDELDIDKLQRRSSPRRPRNHLHLSPHSHPDRPSPPHHPFLPSYPVIAHSSSPSLPAAASASLPRSASASVPASAAPSSVPPAPVVPELPLDDDAPISSARSSQAAIDNRPHFRLPIGSANNSYLTQMSSYKSLANTKANELHRDYTKIFCREEKQPLPPDESSIEIAGGDLYVEGSIFDRWELREKIGEGAYAIVRAARRKSPPPAPVAHQLPENGLAAVKIISKRNPEYYNDKMVSREVFSYRLLEMAGGHANIVELYEVYEDEENVYLVMELLQGGELFARIVGRGEYTEHDAANLVISMLASLAFCHRHNLTHRDVKPENFVFVEPDGDDADVKLTDFGIAHYSEDPTALCKTLCGTPLYVAPEVLLRQPYGPEADLWSLGVIVYIMLVGYPPFDDNDIVQLVKKIKYRPVKFDGNEWMLVSKEGKEFLGNLLDKDKSNRMTAQQALEHDWLRNNCQAASKNVLDVAKSNLKSFVNQKRHRAAIQDVKAMNRITRMVESAHAAEVDDLDDISAEKVEVVMVQRPEDVDPPEYDADKQQFVKRRFSASSSSTEESFDVRKTPVENLLEKAARPPLQRQGNGSKKRISSLMVPSGGRKQPAPAEQSNGASMVLLPIDRAFESSGESVTLVEDRPVRRVLPKSMRMQSGLTRMETSPVVGRDVDEDSRRVGRTLTRGGGVVRKMSSHARRLVGRGKRSRGNHGTDMRPPVMLEMGEHRKQKRFPWLR